MIATNRDAAWNRLQSDPANDHGTIDAQGIQPVTQRLSAA